MKLLETLPRGDNYKLSLTIGFDFRFTVIVDRNENIDCSNYTDGSY